MMKPTLTDQEFVEKLQACLSVSDGWFDICRGFSFTPSQITKLCEVSTEKEFPQVYLRSLNLTSEDIDILIKSDNTVALRKIFDSIPLLTPEQIEIGLNHPINFVREGALKHQNCTEAQKVQYFLKWGSGHHENIAPSL